MNVVGLKRAMPALLCLWVACGGETSGTPDGGQAGGPAPGNPGGTGGIQDSAGGSGGSGGTGLEHPADGSVVDAAFVAPDGSTIAVDGGAMDAATVEQPSCPATVTWSAGDSPMQIQVDGTMRSYLLHVPAGYDGQTAVPLLLDFHGLHSSSQGQRNNSGYAARSDAEGFVVAYPQGIDNAWNLGQCCTQSRDVDDVAFARAIVSELKTQGCIDPARVYAAGYSNGGGMSYMLACHAADVFAAIAPAAFDLFAADEMPCQPSRPIAVLSQRGTADSIVAYTGGASTPPTLYPLPTLHFQGAEATLATWATLDGCTGTPTADANGCQLHTSCTAGVEVGLCTTQGGGHATGNATVGWSFLSRFARP